MYKLYLALILFFTSNTLSAQNVGIGTTKPDASAQLDVNSNNKGILFPRVTSSERKAIASPATGLMVFDIEKNVPYYFNGTKWMPLGPIDPKDVQPIEFGGNSTTKNDFGRSVGISGNYAAVGIPNYDTLSSVNIGAVLIYKKTNGVWGPNQLIIAPDSASGDGFGHSMDMQGDYLVVGAPTKNVLATDNSGKIYIYKLNNGSSYFELDGQLTHPSGLVANSLFGASVAITSRSPVTGGVAIVVGAPQYTVGGTVKGTVSFFRRVGVNNYPTLNTLGGIQTNEQFGFAVDIDSNLVIIGAPYYDTTNAAVVTFNAAGRVQMNRYNAGNYGTFEKSFTPNLDTSTYYGYSVAIDSASFMVGPMFSSENINGTVRNYFRIGIGNYSINNNYDVFDDNEVSTSISAYQGCQLAISSSCMLIGVPHCTQSATSTSLQTGEIEYTVINKKDDGFFSYSGYSQPLPPSKVASSGFGWDVAVWKNDYIISAPNITSANGNKGAVYFGSITE